MKENMNQSHKKVHILHTIKKTLSHFKVLLYKGWLAKKLTKIVASRRSCLKDGEARKNMPEFFKFVVCDPSQSSPTLTAL